MKWIKFDVLDPKTYPPIKKENEYLKFHHWFIFLDKNYYPELAYLEVDNDGNLKFMCSHEEFYFKHIIFWFPLLSLPEPSKEDE